MTMQKLPIEKLVKDDCNVRDEDNEEFDELLVGNIKENGILQPPLGRPLEDGTIGIYVGWTRVKDAKEAGLTEIDIDVRERTNTEAKLASTTENILRNDLSPMNRASAIASMLTVYKRVYNDVAIADTMLTFNTDTYTLSELAEKLGTTKQAIWYWVAPMKWSQELKEAVTNGDMPFDVAEAIAIRSRQESDDLEQQIDIQNAIAEAYALTPSGVTHRDIEKFFSEMKSQTLDEVLFKLKHWVLRNVSVVMGEAITDPERRLLRNFQDTLLGVARFRADHINLLEDEEIRKECIDVVKKAYVVCKKALVEVGEINDNDNKMSGGGKGELIDVW